MIANVDQRGFLRRRDVQLPEPLDIQFVRDPGHQRFKRENRPIHLSVLHHIPRGEQPPVQGRGQSVVREGIDEFHRNGARRENEDCGNLHGHRIGRVRGWRRRARPKPRPPFSVLLHALQRLFGSLDDRGGSVLGR